MTLSILHRATGVFLSLGLVLLVAWLASLAAGEQAHASFTAFATSWPVQVLVGLMLISFCYHLANGVRHLVWDLGRGLERHQARASGRAVVVFTVLASAVVLYLAFFHGGRP
jgi:succinate dehydrogenase / fumarate reductase cytochrome b subunit